MLGREFRLLNDREVDKLFRQQSGNMLHLQYII
jgi:hypothetical protein